MAMVTVMFQGETVGSHTIKHHPFVVGRDATCDIQIDNIGVSREHCQFVHADRHFNIEDLKSANGTILHGQKIRMAPVRDGDEIKMGKYTLVFHQAPGEGAPPPKGGAEPDLAEAMKGAEQAAPTKAGGFSGERTLMVQGMAAPVPGAPSSGPQRAADVAGKLAGGGKGGGGGMGLWIVVGFMALVVLGLAAVVLILVLKKQPPAPERTQTPDTEESAQPDSPNSTEQPPPAP